MTPTLFVARASKLWTIAAISLRVSGAVMGGVAVLHLAACGKKEAPVPVEEPAPEAAASPKASPSPGKPTVIAAPPPSATPTPESEPTPFASRTAYVAVAFQSVSDVGTHDFPLGATVQVVGESGDDYIVEYQGVSVQNHRAYFSDIPVELPVPATTAESPSLTEDPLPAATPDLPTSPAEAQAEMTSEEKETSELLSKIKDLNEEIRVTSEKLDKDPASSAAAKAEAARLERLKKQKERLSEDLTSRAKP